VRQLRRSFALPVLMLIVGCCLLCFFAPWQQVHPSDASLVHFLGRAAIWTHAYDAVPGARLDSFELVLETTVLLSISVLVGLSRESTAKRETS
jgi:hypothetical protein